jgi:hypothetical protein
VCALHYVLIYPNRHAYLLCSAQAQTSEEAALVKDVKADLEEILGALSGKGSKGSSNINLKGAGRGARPGVGSKGDDVRRIGAKKCQRLRGEARKAAWQNVKDLRKELVNTLMFLIGVHHILYRYRKREEGVVKSVLSRAQVIRVIIS